MTLRVFLAVAILAALGAALLGQLLLRPHIQQIIQQREANAHERDQQASMRQKVEAALVVVRAEREDALKKAAESDQQRVAALAGLHQAREAVARLDEDLARARRDKLEVERTLARWQALGLTPEETVRFRDTWKSLKGENEALATLNHAWAKEVQHWSNLVASFVPPDDPLMPADLQGHVAAVDSKWGFVVLDIGGRKGIRPRGILLVSRNGLLVAQIKVTRVEPDRSIAEVVPGTRLSEVFEGDRVISRLPIVPYAAVPRS